MAAALGFDSDDVPVSSRECGKGKRAAIPIVPKRSSCVEKDVNSDRRGLFSEPETVYDARTRQPPTEELRSTLTDVAPPEATEVKVEFESMENDRSSGTYTTQWTPAGEKSESLIISLSPDFDVEFFIQ